MQCDSSGNIFAVVTKPDGNNYTIELTSVHCSEALYTYNGTRFVCGKSHMQGCQPVGEGFVMLQMQFPPQGIAPKGTL